MNKLILLACILFSCSLIGCNKDPYQKYYGKYELKSIIGVEDIEIKYEYNYIELKEKQVYTVKNKLNGIETDLTGSYKIENNILQLKTIILGKEVIEEYQFEQNRITLKQKVGIYEITLIMEKV